MMSSRLSGERRDLLFPDLTTWKQLFSPHHDTEFRVLFDPKEQSSASAANDAASYGLGGGGVAGDDDDDSGDNTIMIAWYCFIAVSALVLIFVFVAFLYRWYYRRVQLPAIRARRATLETARQAALVRMQANVSKFTAHENTQRTRDLCALLLPQTIEIMENDPRLCNQLSRASECTLDEEEIDETIVDVEQQASNEPLPNVSPAPPSSSSCCCLICLEEWKAGEFICQSAGCRHVFHQTCIISWLVNHRSDCPACRQAFLPVENDSHQPQNDSHSNNNNNDGDMDNQSEDEYEA